MVELVPRLAAPPSARRRLQAPSGPRAAVFSVIVPDPCRTPTVPRLDALRCRVSLRVW